MVPSTHMRWLTNACNSSSRGTNGHALLPFTGTCRHGEHIHALRHTDILKKEVSRSNWYMRHLTQIQSGGYPCNTPSSATSFNTNLPLAGHFLGKSLYWLGRAMSFHECEGRARCVSHSGCGSVYNTGIIFTNLVNNNKSDLKKKIWSLGREVRRSVARIWQMRIWICPEVSSVYLIWPQNLYYWSNNNNNKRPWSPQWCLNAHSQPLLPIHWQSPGEPVFTMCGKSQSLWPLVFRLDLFYLPYCSSNCSKKFQALAVNVSVFKTCGCGGICQGIRQWHTYC